MDLSGELRFSENRNLRFVANDGSNHNHTAGLRPWVARGVTSLYTPNPSNGPRYYIAPRDSLFAAAVTSQYGSLAYIAAFAVPFSSQDSQYRISPLYVLHNSGEVAYTGANSTDAGNAVAPYSGYAALLDYREFRELRRIGVTDHTVLPYTTIQDATTNKYYRVCRVYDNGRYANFLVEWPTLAYITVIP
jgi:hypothetical protein